VLTCRANVFTNPHGLISYIAKHPEGACVHPDMTVVFSDEWTSPKRGSKARREFFARA